MTGPVPRAGTAGDEQGPVQCANAADEEPAGTVQPHAVTPRAGEPTSDSPHLWPHGILARAVYSCAPSCWVAKQDLTFTTSLGSVQAFLSSQWQNAVSCNRLTANCAQAIRRGTLIGMQLQVVFVFVVVLLAAQAQVYLSGLPSSTLARAAAVLVPYIAVLTVAAVMCWAPWELPAKRPPATAVTPASREPEEATHGAEVDTREHQPAAEGASEAEKPSEHVVRTFF